MEVSGPSGAIDADIDTYTHYIPGTLRAKVYSPSAAFDADIDTYIIFQEH